MASATVQTAAGWRDLKLRSQDNLELYARDYGPPDHATTPIVCIPGLTRSARDFHDLASHLAPRRRILALDLRGRGRSARDPQPRNYTPRTEMFDVLDVLTAAGIEKAIVVGTSRGGLIAMAMAAARPCALAGVVLNDIGPKVETEGLASLLADLARVRSPADWESARAVLKERFEASFTNLSADEWTRFAHTIFADEAGRPVLDFDPAIVDRLAETAPAGTPLPEMWPLFEALCSVPVLAIRGENSAILSAATLEQMAAHHPRLKALTVPHRGHAPFLNEPPVLAAIDDFIAGIEAPLNGREA